MRTLFIGILAMLCGFFVCGQVQPNSGVVFFGDSQTSFGYSNNNNSAGTVVQFQNFGYIAWVNALAPDVYMPRNGMLGVPGETTTQMLSRLNALKAADAKIAVIMAGTNDPLYPGGTPAVTESNLRQAYDAALSVGMRVIAITIQPRFGQNAYNATNEANRLLINQWIKSQTDVIVVDVENDVNDPKYFEDGLHNSPLGAFVVGKKVASEINKLVQHCAPGSVSASQLAVASNSNPFFAGTGGRMYNSTGAVAASWELGANFAGGAQVSGAKEIDPATGRERQVVNVSGNYSGNTRKFTLNNYAAPPIGLAAGDLVEGVVEIEIPNAMVGIKNIFLQLQVYNSDYSTTISQAYSMFPTSAKGFPVPPGSYLLRTPILTIGSTTPVGQITTVIQVDFLSTATTDPVSATIKFNSAGVRRLPIATGPLQPVLSPSGSIALCPGASVQLNAGAPNNNYAYQWRLNGNPIKDSTASSLVASAAGDYTLSVSVPGCTMNSAPITITPKDCGPQATLVTDFVVKTNFCRGENFLLPFHQTGSFGGTNRYTAQLSDAAGSFATPTVIGFLDGNSGGSIPASLPTTLPAGSGYRIRVVSSAPALIGQDNGQTLTVNLPPSASISPATATVTYPNLPTILTASPGGNSYQWLFESQPFSPAATSQSIPATQAGAYRVVVTNASGCFDTAKAVTVSLQPCSAFVINATTTDGSNYTASASGGIPPYLYSLNNSVFQSQNSLPGLQQGQTYTLYVKDSVNCTGSLTFTVPVQKSGQTITFNPILAHSYGDAPFTLTATSTSGLPVSFQVISGPATIANGLVTLTGAGTVTIEATQAGDPSYNAAPPVQQSFAVNKAGQAISFGSLPGKVYGDEPFSITGSASSGLPVVFTVISGPATLTGNTVSISGAGVVVIEATQGGDGNYNAATPVQQSFTVSVAPQVINFGAITNKVLGDAPFELTATSTSRLPVNYRVVSGNATINNNFVTVGAIGDVTIEASQPGDQNYAAATPVLQSFSVVPLTVGKSNQTINFTAPGNKSFTDAPFALTATATSGLPVSFQVIAGPATIANGLVTLTGAGTVTIEATQAGDPSYNAAPPVQQSFAVNKAGQAISFGPLADKAFGDAPINLTGSASSGLPVNYMVVSGPATVAGSSLTITGAGIVVVEASQAGNANYVGALAVQTSFTVAKANQSVSFAAIPNKNLGSGSFTVTATSSSGLPVSFRIVSGPATLSANVVSLTGTGSVTIEASQAGNSNFNAATSVNQSFVVSSGTKQAQTITFGTLSYKTFGSAPFTLTATASSGLPVNFRIVSGPATVAGDQCTLTGVGTVVVEANQAGDASYNAALPVQKSFSVGKGGQTITFPYITNKVYGDAPFALTATASSGLPVSYRVVSGPASVSGGIVTLTGTGQVIIEATQSGNANYNPSYAVQRTFNVLAPTGIVKQSQTITFGTIADRTYGDPAFTLTATASSGLAVSFRIVSGPASLAGNTLTLSGTGSVVVEASQAGDSYFTAASPVTQSFNVAPPIASKFSQSINFVPIGNKTYGDPAFAITATTSSGLAPSFRIVSGSATIAGNIVTLKGAGVISVEASQDGSGTYNPATPVTQSFSVAKANQTINYGPLANKIYGDAPFNLTYTATSGIPVIYRVVSGPATVSGSLVTITGVGTVTIEASQPGNTNFNAAPTVQQSFAVAASGIAKQAQTITFGTLSYKTYGAAPFQLGATASSGLTVSYRVVSGPATITGDLCTVTGVGSVVIEAAQAGNANYNAAPSVQRTLSVGKAGQTITFPVIANQVYGNAPFNLTATATSGLAVKYRIVSGPATVAGSLVTLTGVGTVTIEATQSGDANYNPSYALQRSFTVSAPPTNLMVSSLTAHIGSGTLLPTVITGKQENEAKKDVVEQSKLAIFPNPVSGNGSVIVTLAKTGMATLEVVDMQGRLIKQLPARAFEKGQASVVDLKVQEMAGGTYLLRVRTRDVLLTQLFTVLK